jgi:exonuclease SbcD
MKFIHFSDCHIGGWRDEKLSELGIKAFKIAIDQSIEKHVDFVIIAGDLFNSALPPLDKLRETVITLKRLKQNSIPCYVIPGSHDFSPSGKTMLDILEHTGLLVNVCKGTVEDNVLRLNFTIDAKTGAKLTGMIGKKGMLDRKYYEQLDRSILENEKGFKIFLFHTALAELKPKELELMEAHPVSLLPKGFDYYAGGHVHIVANKTIGEYQNVVYPGALFPNNFREVEIFKNGGYYLYEDGAVSWHPVIAKDVVCLHFDCNNKTPAEVEKEIVAVIKNTDVADKIVTVRVQGELLSGRSSDIHFNDTFGILYHKGAYFVMKSTSLVKSREFEVIQTPTHSVEDAEDRIIRENMGQSTVKNEKELAKNLMKVLSLEKQEGETKYTFEKRLLEETSKVLER